MSGKAVIDLTVEDANDHEDLPSGHVPSVSKFRGGFRNLIISPSTLSTPKRRRKRSDVCLGGISAINACPDKTVPESTPTKKQKCVSARGYASFDICDQSWPTTTLHQPDRPTPSKRNDQKDKNSDGKHITTIEIVEDEDDDVYAQINRSFPLHNKLFCPPATALESLAVQIEDNSEDDGSESGSSEAITLDDFLTDVELRKYLHNLKLEEETKREAQLNQRIFLPGFKGPRFTCAPGKGVELEDGSFLRIKEVSQNGRGDIFVSGQHLVRENFLGSKMPKRMNEIVWIEAVIKEPGKDAKVKEYEVSISKIRSNRELIFTNQRYPAVSSRNDPDSFANPTQNVELGPLFCRWKRTTVSDTENKVVEEVIEHLGYLNADDRVRRQKDGTEAYTRIADIRSRYSWRQTTTTPGGSQKLLHEVHDLNGNARMSETDMYTFGDAFCGAGGASRGALDAGLFVQWGFDMDEQAITSYLLNFGPGGTDCRHEAVDEFLRRVHTDPPITDILHISPPCQPWSHAHTIDSPQRDEINQAALFSVWHLIETLKPRVVTMEETDGLTNRHHEWFSALVNIFINLGYSVRWAVLRCERYAVPQTRKRLLIIASGPGEKLPPFPSPTHDMNDPALKDLVTIDDMIANIPPNAADHNTNTQFDGGPRAPYSGQTQAKTLTCKGGDNYHPSGTRPFTIRELASLQTFPLYHSFAGARGITAAKQQIGNAVPPVLARALFRTIIKSLKEADGVL